MTDPTFRNINRLFVVSFNDCGNDPTRDSFDKYYVSLAEIKDFSTLIDNKPFSQPLRNKQKAYEKTWWNIKKKWLYNRKFIGLFLTLKLL